MTKRERKKLSRMIRLRIDEDLYREVSKRAECATVTAVVRRALAVYLAVLGVLEEPTA